MYALAGLLGGIVGTMPDPLLWVVFFIGWALKKKRAFDVAFAGILWGILTGFVSAMISAEGIRFMNGFWFSRIIASCIWAFLGYWAGRRLKNKKAKAASVKAAEQGDAAAQWRLGMSYLELEGEGLPQGMHKAAEWFQKSAAQGYADAQVILGGMYLSGHGVPQDYHKAVEYFQRAADQGNTEGQYGLGLLYHNGRGVTKDDNKAAEWIQKAADHGHAQAQFELGGMYACGRYVSQSFSKSLEWYKKSAEQGYEPAKEFLKNLK